MPAHVKRLGAVVFAVALLAAGAPTGALAARQDDQTASGKSDTHKPIGVGVGRRNG